MKTIFIILLPFFYMQINAQECMSAYILQPNEFKNHISTKEVQLVDVRTEREYNSGHIDGALNANVLQLDAFKFKTNVLDKDKPIYIYCRSGNRSIAAAKTLCEMGFKQVYDLKGGYLTLQ